MDKKVFNPNEHMSKLKGKDYLEVKWRLVWFREEHPNWGIETNVLEYDDRKALVQARIIDENGRILAMGTKTETPSGFADYLEKAETGAVGRALGMLGYGTQFAPEFDEGERVVDSPVSKPAGKPVPQPTITEQAKQAFGADKVSEVEERNVTEEERKALWTLAKSKGYTKEQFGAELAKMGYASSAVIPFAKLKEVREFFSEVSPPFAN